MIEWRAARPEEVPGLKELWKISFGDEDGYIDLFFDTQFRPEETLVALRDHQTVSMLTGFPMQVCLPDGAEYSASYIYALCTHPAFRSGGIARDLLSCAADYFQENGKALLLIKPGAPGLYAYFQKQGFAGGFPLSEVFVTGEDLGGWEPEGSLDPAEPEAYCARREAILKSRLHVKCDRRTAAHQKELSRRSGADLYFLRVNGAVGCAAAEYALPGHLVVKELLLPGMSWRTSFQLLARHLPAQDYRVRLPAFESEITESRREDFFLIKYFFSGQKAKIQPYMPGYPGFAFD
ncbi:MAG: GNAT family N-acetyltransferase [Oscillospiraceae bacterium]|nr:GNAT family N-acetyltransferase [Oscillospiraceae bacterium]